MPVIYTCAQNISFIQLAGKFCCIFMISSYTCKPRILQNIKTFKSSSLCSSWDRNFCRSIIVLFTRRTSRCRLFLAKSYTKISHARTHLVSFIANHQTWYTFSMMFLDTRIQGSKQLVIWISRDVKTIAL